MSRVSRDYFKLDLGVLRPDRWLFQPGSARQLAAMRIGLCALVALRVGLRPSLYLDLSQQEASLFRPLSWAKLFDHMPSRGLLLAALIVCVIAAKRRRVEQSCGSLVFFACLSFVIFVVFVPS